MYMISTKSQNVGKKYDNYKFNLLGYTSLRIFKDELHHFFLNR